ncbi:uncharacterized protein BO80DRAFT_290165 [Aspergillus ibericus CBS 121593]|uniref:Uncharacterized protein n=1 Tax=Aspergillus ibericus CBS 121593 TaxID=1448316 RepID=A0A395GLV3_9EURO|nr:hypothetical protein BO80DRAFT_290165 [Aspergillus ibericus CBS 121593]RAK95003.1 hypothetical protein BO80DRAFT_290165 [Aspergillus ibericus CBS 121593]
MPRSPDHPEPTLIFPNIFIMHALSFSWFCIIFFFGQIRPCGFATIAYWSSGRAVVALRSFYWLVPCLLFFYFYFFLFPGPREGGCGCGPRLRLSRVVD